MSAKSDYLIKTLMRALFCFKVVIEAFSKGCIVIPNSMAFKIATWTTNISEFSFNSALANFFFLMSSTRLVVSRALAAM